MKGRLIDGGQLRLDTTAVETDIHWPTDSTLLWDTYRTLARYIEQIREIDPAVVGDRRLLVRKVKRLSQKIARKASKKPKAATAMKPLYIRLFELVQNIYEWSDEIAEALARHLVRGRYGDLDHATMELCRNELVHYRELGERVIDQARR